MKFTYLNIFVFFVTIYFLTSSESYFFHADASYLRFDVAESLVERLDLTVTEGLGVEGADGRDYSWIGLGSALVSVPFYLAGKIIGTPEVMISFVNPIFAALTAGLLFMFVNALGYTKRASITVVMFYGLGTIAWPLSKQPFDHPIETFFLLLSFFHCYQFTKHKKTRDLMFSGAAAGMAFLTRPTTVLVLPALIVLTLHNDPRKYVDIKTVFKFVKGAIQFSTSYLPFAGISLWYNHYRFGSIFETGYSLIASRLGIDFFSGTSLLTGLSGFLMSPGKGFFFYSPVAVLFFFSIKSFHKKHPTAARAFILLMSSYLLFLSRNIYWHGDWTWGPRYLLAITPFFIIPLAEIADSLSGRKEVLKYSFYAIFTISFIIQIAAVSVDFTKYFINLKNIDNINFTYLTGEGVQPITEPPTKVYFQWSNSPILAQFKYIIEIGKNIYEHQNGIATNLNSIPNLNLYDFWWLYIFFINGNHSVLVLTFILLSTSVYSAYKLFHEVK